MIRFFRCENPTCKKEFSLIEGNKDSSERELCPYCNSSKLTLLRKEGYVHGKRKKKEPEQQEDFFI